MIWRNSIEKIVYYGTFNEFLDLLHKKNFWITEKDYQIYCKDEKNTLFNNCFGKYSANFKDKSLDLVPASKGYLIIEKSKHNYTHTRFCIDSKEFTQTEINQAFALAFEALKRKDSPVKDFIITKEVIT